MFADELFPAAAEIAAANLRLAGLDPEQAQIVGSTIAAEIVGHARSLECLEVVDE